MSLLALAAVFLGAAVVAVPIFRRLGLGAVLGYLVAGLAIGPWGLNLFSQVEDLLHFAEFGVVLLLFIIGLELQPKRLWTLRKSVFGQGGAQVLITATVISGVVYLLADLTPGAAVTIGLGLSLSSTAFALQTLAEKHQLSTRHGRSAFSILLFQDMAVIPMLALLPLLSPVEDTSTGNPYLLAARTVAVLIGVVVGGHFLLRHVLRLVARSGVQEIFTAMALLTVVGTALLMEAVGLSMALGAFLAGVLLADSEYRHELEANIEPFKGLLLGLFFIAVGMSVDVGLIVASPGLVLALVVGLLAIKFAVLFALGRFQGLDFTSSLNLAAIISQGGEFAFVIFNMAVGDRIMDAALADLLIVVVTLSMVFTPLLFGLSGYWAGKLKAPASKGPYDQPPAENQMVIIAGFGRFAQITARILRAKKIPFTALESNQEQVDLARLFGNKVYYGDASRLEVLRAAGADTATAFVLAIDDVEESLHIAATVRKHFPGLKIYARARDRQHAYRLMDLGIDVVWREMFLSSLELSRDLLRGLGYSGAESNRVISRFRQHDEQLLYAHRSLHSDHEKMVHITRQAARELEELFTQDEANEAQTE